MHMQGGNHADPGSFQEYLDTMNFIAPKSDMDMNQEEQPVMSKLLVVGLALTAVVPTFYHQLAFVGALGGAVLLAGLFRIRKLSGWFRAALVFAAVLLAACAAKTVLFSFEEVTRYNARDMVTADPILSGIGLVLLLTLTVGVRKHEGYMTPWLVLALVAYCGIFILGYTGGANWVFAAKPVLGLFTIFAYYRVYKTI